MHLHSAAGSTVPGDGASGATVGEVGKAATGGEVGEGAAAVRAWAVAELEADGAVGGGLGGSAVGGEAGVAAVSARGATAAHGHCCTYCGANSVGRSTAVVSRLTTSIECSDMSMLTSTEK